MADYGYEEVSNEEKLQIAQHFLLSSPPGQFQEVLTDVQKLLPSNLLTDALAAGMARAYNNRWHPVASGSSSSIVLAQEAEVDPTHYIDPASQQVVGVDHLGPSIEDGDVRPHTNAGPHEGLRSALQEGVTQYVNNFYISERAAGGVYETSGELLVLVSGERFNLKNFWSGRWSSEWHIRPSGSSATVTGTITLHAHYFEDGNVQLQTSKPCPEVSIAFGSDEEFVNVVLAYIEEQETNTQHAMSEMYNTMSAETLKSMRRSTTLYGSKFDWNVAKHRLARGGK
jgi:capping protein alpha